MPRSVSAIEGTPTHGIVFVTPVLEGSHVALLHVRMERGARSEMHVHQHESLIYVLSGALETVVGDQLLVVRQGEPCLHPENVPHSVHALEDTVFLEVKSPVPDLRAIFSTP